MHGSGISRDFLREYRNSRTLFLVQMRRLLRGRKGLSEDPRCGRESKGRLRVKRAVESQKCG